MTILLDTHARVKSAVRKPRRFGTGILATAPSYRVEYSAADAAWWAAESAAMEAARTGGRGDATRQTPPEAQRAAEARRLGLIPAGLAEAIMARTLLAGY